MPSSTDGPLQIALEEVGARSWWKALIATLGSQSGSAYLRFVARLDGQTRYTSATFVVPRTLGELPPQEQWAPGMTQSLADLRAEIERDGWQEDGIGEQPWAVRYHLPHGNGISPLRR